MNLYEEMFSTIEEICEDGENHGINLELVQMETLAEALAESIKEVKEKVKYCHKARRELKKYKKDAPNWCPLKKNDKK